MSGESSREAFRDETPGSKVLLSRAHSNLDCVEREEPPLLFLRAIDKLPELARASIPSHFADCASCPASRSNRHRITVYCIHDKRHDCGGPAGRECATHFFVKLRDRLINFHAPERDEVTA